jgi:hypothetical protein
MTVKKDFSMRAGSYRFVEIGGDLFVQPLVKEPKNYPGQSRDRGSFKILAEEIPNFLKALSEAQEK